MKIHHIIRRQTLPIEQDLAWAFLSNPANLLQLSPPWAEMRDESIDLQKVIYPGMLQVLSMKLPGGLPCRWVAEITHVDAPNAFVDEQKIGPFAFWHHRHSLEPVEDGVDIVDTVHYAVPFAPVGEIVHSLMIRRELERLFDYRAQMMDEFFGEY